MCAAAAGSCAEFLVHGVDVEGMQLGVDEELIRLLGAASPLPVTYAGGVRSLVLPAFLSQETDLNCLGFRCAKSLSSWLSPCHHACQSMC